MGSSHRPRLSVLIPTFRRPDLLYRCLTALRMQTTPPEDFEICVVDDASGPDVVGVLERAGAKMPNLVWVSQPTNRGPAAARNRAASLAEGQLLLFVDDDVIASTSLVETHLACHERAGQPLSVMGRLTWYPDVRVTPFMRWLDASGMQFNFAKMVEGPQTDIINSFYTCNLSLPLADFMAVGGFDERFPYAACEDSDLGLRLARHGLAHHYRPAALAWHARPVTLQEFRTRMRQAGQSWQTLAALHPDYADPIEAPTGVHRLNRAVRRAILAGLAAIVPSGSAEWLWSRHYRAQLAHACEVGARRGTTIASD